MAGRTRYADGFTLLSQLESNGVRYYPIGNGVAVAKGDALILTAGYIALATTLQATTPVFIGIAASNCTAAEASSNGALDIAVIPPLRQYQFIVPEEDNLLVAADRGLLVDLQSEDGIDNSDIVTAGMGFFIDEIDVTAASLAASATFGHAIGHFGDYVAAS